MGKFDGKVSIITGAASGMGVSHARVFVEEGSKVVIADFAEEAGKKLAENARFLRLDVTDPETWTSVVNATEATFGPTTVLVDNAGVAGPDA